MVKIEIQKFLIHTQIFFSWIRNMGKEIEIRKNMGGGREKGEGKKLKPLFDTNGKCKEWSCIAGGKKLTSHAQPIAYKLL